MGFIDIFKRWRLAQKGMSSGKKRRTTTKSESSLLDSIDRSFWIKILIYPVFCALVCFLIPYAQTESPLYTNDAAKRTVICLVLCIAMIFYYHMRHSLSVRNTRVFLVFGLVFINIVMVWLSSNFVVNNDWCHNDFMLLIPPVAFAPMVLSVLVGRHAGVFAALSTSLYGCLLVPEADVFSFIIISLMVGCVAVALTRKVRRRGSLLRAGFYAGLTTFLLAVVFDKIHLFQITSPENFTMEGLKIAVVIIAGMLTGMVVSGLLPALESMFNITTSISWLEMSDLNHKLLRRLQLEAPGSYHHSMVVATLAESAAEEIGANASMCRVCSYFHDIGKLKKPEYFIENQGDQNPHDSLSPTMSAIVIIAHVKDGVDMAIKHKLNPKIVDVIREHHGDSLVKYFYHKAKEQRAEAEGKEEEGKGNKDDLSEVDVKNFKYPGPCPSTRESGIISLADCVESASRSLNKPTPQKINGLVNDIVMGRLTNGQLDDSGLTMGEVKKLIKSFSSTLRSMMHTRIDYPKDDDENAEAEKTKLVEVKFKSGKKPEFNSDSSKLLNKSSNNKKASYT